MDRVNISKFQLVRIFYNVTLNKKRIRHTKKSLKLKFLTDFAKKRHFLKYKKL